MVNIDLSSIGVNSKQLDAIREFCDFVWDKDVYMYDVGFYFMYTFIVNPFYTMDGRFEVNPITEYGSAFTTSVIVKIAKSLPLSENASAEEVQVCVYNLMHKLEECHQKGENLADLYYL